MYYRGNTGLRAIRGFTVMEIVVSLSIVAILAALAAPSLQGFLREQRLSSTMSQLVNDLHFARAEAIKRNARVLVCAKTGASTTCTNQLDWQAGWIVCYDANSDDQCDASTAMDPNPMKATNSLHTSLRLAGSTALVRFSPIGTSNGSTTLTLTGSWTDSTRRTGTIATTGYVSSRKN